MSKCENTSESDPPGPVDGSSMSAENSENVPRKRYANQLAKAAGVHVVLPLSEKPLMRNLFPYLLRWKTTLESLVDRIDSTVEAVVDTSSDLLAASLDRVSVLSCNPWAAGSDNTLIPSPAELRAALASKWGATSTWIDERFDVHVALLEDFTDKWLPSSQSHDDQGPPKSRGQRLLAVPYRVRGGLMRYAVMAADRLQSATQQIIVSIKNFAFAILVTPKLENPQSMPPVGGFLPVTYVVLYSKVEHLTQRIAVALGAFNLWESAFLTTKAVTTACRQYYNYWPIPSAGEMQQKIILFDGRVKEMYESLSDEKKKWIRHQYNRILRIARGMMGGRASDGVAHFLAKSLIVQAIQDLSPPQNDSSSALKNVKQEANVIQELSPPQNDSSSALKNVKQEANVTQDLSPPQNDGSPRM